VVQSVAEYERKENTLAMLQLISQAEQDIQESRTKSMDEALVDLRSKLGLL